MFMKNLLYLTLGFICAVELNALPHSKFIIFFLYQIYQFSPTRPLFLGLVEFGGCQLDFWDYGKFVFCP